MPTYVYECSSCNTQFEVFQRITENALDTCQCGSTGTVKRLIQPIAVLFKGSGFHINDYAPKGAGESAPESKPEAPPASSSEPASTPASAPAAAPATESGK
jgi:putative FmdB family regulatory protein